MPPKSRKDSSMKDAPKGLTTFLKRHKQVLTILSAAVVFVSFALKEELGEYLKDKLQILESVDAKIEKNSDHFRQETEQTVIHERLALITGILKGMHKDPHTTTWQEYMVNETSIKLSRLNQMTSNIAAVERISKRDEYYKAAIKRLNEKRQKQITAQAMINFRETPELTPEEKKQAAENNRHWSELEHEAEELENEALEELATQRKKIERAITVTK